MKKSLFLIASMAFAYVTPVFADTDISGIDNTLYAERTTCKVGEQVELAISMKNSVEITSLEFHLALPDGVVVAEEDGDLLVDISGSRTTYKKHSIVASIQTDGNLYVTYASSSNKIFSGSDGEICTVTLNVLDGTPAGNYSASLYGMVLTDASDNSAIKPDQVDFTMTVVGTTSVNPNSYGYATYSCDADMKISGGVAYTAVVSGTDIICTAIEDNIIPAYTGVLVFSENGSTISFTPATASAPVRANDLLPTTTHSGLAEVPATGYVYVLNENKFRHYTGSAFTPNKAYFNLNITPARLNIIIDDETSITSIEVSNSTNTIYDLQGHHQRNMQSGVNIINGQKAMVK